MGSEPHSSQRSIVSELISISAATERLIDSLQPTASFHRAELANTLRTPATPELLTPEFLRAGRHGMNGIHCADASRPATPDS